MPLEEEINNTQLFSTNTSESEKFEENKKLQKASTSLLQDEIKEIYQDLSSYLLKKVSIIDINEKCKSILPSIQEQNEEFIQNQLYENIDYKDFLTINKKKIIETLGPEYFPKTLNPEMCDFIHVQMLPHNARDSFKIKRHYYQTDIFGSMKNINFIPIFIPERYNLLFYRLNKKHYKKNPSELLQELEQLKINYITVKNVSMDIINMCIGSKEIKYVFNCTNKLKYSDKPEIFVCIPDMLMDTEGDFKHSLENKDIKVVFYKKIEQIKELLYGCCRVTIDRETNPGILEKDGSKSKSRIAFNNILLQFKKFHNRVKYKINQQLLTHLLPDKKRKIINDINDEKNIECYTTFIGNSTNLKKEFCELNKKISEKYNEEIQKGLYNIEKLKKSNIFHISSNIYYTEPIDYILNKNKIQSIESNIINDIEKYQLNDNYNIIDSKNAIFLLPFSYSLTENDKAADILYKNNLIRNAKIEQAHYVYLGITEELEKNIGLNDFRVVAAFTNPISAKNALNDKEILVLLPKAFNLQGKPLFDPNMFKPKVYFYTNVNKYNTTYHLYEFKVEKLLPYQHQEIHKNDFRQKYITKNNLQNNFDQQDLAGNLIKAYSDFHEIVKLKSIYLQNSIQYKNL